AAAAKGYEEGCHALRTMAVPWCLHQSVLRHGHQGLVSFHFPSRQPPGGLRRSASRHPAASAGLLPGPSASLQLALSSLTRQRTDDLDVIIHRLGLLLAAEAQH